METGGMTARRLVVTILGIVVAIALIGFQALPALAALWQWLAAG